MPNKQSLANAGAYNAQVQDSHNLHMTGEIMALMTKRFQAAVDRGDPTEIVAILRGMRVQVEVARQWTGELAPEVVESSKQLLDGDPSEHSYTQ
jgi:hypothetical protein